MSKTSPARVSINGRPNRIHGGPPRGRTRLSTKAARHQRFRMAHWIVCGRTYPEGLQHDPLGQGRHDLKTERMVPVDSFVCELVHRLRFFRFLDPLPADGKLLARPLTKEALVRQLRDYFHQVCHSIGLSTRIVPHQLRHTYATEMLRSGVGLAAVMKLLGHTSADMTMRYIDVALSDLQQEYLLARSQPRHLVPQPKTPLALLRSGLDGVIDFAHCSTCARNVPPCTAKRRFTQLPRPALQPAHQDHRGGT